MLKKLSQFFWFISVTVFLNEFYTKAPLQFRLKLYLNPGKIENNNTVK